MTVLEKLKQIKSFVKQTKQQEDEMSRGWPELDSLMKWFQSRKRSEKVSLGSREARRFFSFISPGGSHPFHGQWLSTICFLNEPEFSTRKYSMKFMKMIAGRGTFVCTFFVFFAWSGCRTTSTTVAMRKQQTLRKTISPSFGHFKGQSIASHIIDHLPTIIVLDEHGIKIQTRIHFA